MERVLIPSTLLTTLSSPSKEYGLETKEDHYHKPTKSKENLDEGDESFKETESSKSTDSSKGKGKETQLIV